MVHRMRKENIDKLANDVSNIAINRVLCEDLDIREALEGLFSSVSRLYRKTLPDEEYLDMLENSNELTKTIFDLIKNEHPDTNLHEILLSMSLLARALNNCV